MILGQMMPGMQWIPLMILLLVCGFSAGTVSVFASVFQTHSPVGRVAGKTAVWIGGLATLLFAFLTGSHLTPLGYFWLASPAAVGLAGLGLTRIPAGRALNLTRALIVVVTASAALTLGYRSWQNIAAGRQMMKLLAGSDDVAIVQLEADGQRRHAICRSPELCAYLTEAFRRPKKEGHGAHHGPGASYQFTLRFATGDQYQVHGSTHANGLSFSVPEAHPVEDGWTTHEIIFDEPVPERLTEMLKFLGLPYEQLAGSVMFVAGARPNRVE